MAKPSKTRDIFGHFWPTAASLLAAAMLPIAPNAQALPNDVVSAPASGQVATGRLTVVMDGFRNSKGRALVALFRKPSAFPKQVVDAEQRAEAAIQMQRARVVFEQVSAGEVALSVLHDEDDDRECRIGIFGIPKEGLGFSRNVRARFGPPDFADAKLEIGAGTQQTLSIHLRYYGF